MTTTAQTEIHYRNLGTGQIKTLTVPTSQAEDAIDMIRNSDTLEYCSAYPVEN
ncbi:hypothetical protein [Phytohabitans aurantiacus]|uniref:Uncharacterized protein n=1 Tax=Phytohabitans aurantiacus TaxID=3016789 RepID=A0ABQ5QVI0_9ACTN|nr:hypothetical protein [Phytohabitans aurantiacus]GLH97365.1 hypothetical protein Pa4123_26400 [Phytohabitans aurantiacus]